MRINIDSRSFAELYGVRNYQIAERWPMSETAFSRKLRIPFSKEEKAKFRRIVTDIVRERSEAGQALLRGLDEGEAHEIR